MKTTRWGIRRHGQKRIRSLRNRTVAYVLAYSAAAGTRQTKPRSADIYVDHGDGKGWTFAQRIENGSAS